MRFRDIQVEKYISPRLMNYVMIPYRWKQFIYHVGRARDHYSVAEAGLVAGGKERKEGRQMIFFTPLDPFNSDANEAEPITDVKKPRKVHYQIRWTSEQDASVLDLLVHSTRCWSRILADRFQCHYYVPVFAKRMRRKGCQRKWKERVFLLARQLTPRERPKVTLRPSWVHARSNNASMPRETESKLQTWKSNPNSSGSRNWPAESEFEQSIDLRVDGIPDDETYKDEQYMQRIAEQVQKTCNNVKFFFF